MITIEPLELDVRPELAKGGEPLPHILEAVRNLAPGQALRLRAPFEPIPLYSVLGRKGYSHHAARFAEGDWEILFTPGQPPEQKAQPKPPAAAAPSRDGDAAASWPAPKVTLDNRGLGPPEPMIRILGALEHLAPGEVLAAINEREPMFLYPELESRGAAIQTRKEADGVHLLIRRGPSA